MRDREMEAESDHRDKQREMEEIDEILRKRLAEPPLEKENEVLFTTYLSNVFNLMLLFQQACKHPHLGISEFHFDQ